MDSFFVNRQQRGRKRPVIVRSGRFFLPTAGGLYTVPCSTGRLSDSPDWHAAATSTTNRGVMSKRIMVDMSATLLHHGHIRLLKKAAELGSVVVALTTDEEVRKTKGYTPELSYEERREILEAIRYVAEVVPSTWLIDDAFLAKHNFDLLVPGHDNWNHIPQEKLVLFPRTEGISTSDMRERVLYCPISLNLFETPAQCPDTLSRLLILTHKT